MSAKGEVIPEAAVRFVRALPAPVSKVWQFLTEPSRLFEWYGDGNIEPREGGAVSLMGGHIRGVVTIWQPEKALGYTWSVFQPGETVSAWPVSYLEMTLAADPASSSEAVGHQKSAGTALTLTHRPIPQAMQNQTAMGWHTYLDLIGAGLIGNFPNRAELFPVNAALYGVDLNALKGDPMTELSTATGFATPIDEHTIQFVRILPGPIEKIWSYLADSDKRGQWFAKGDLPKKVGEKFELRFKHSELSPHQSVAPERMKEIDSHGHTATNTLLKFEPPHVLAFTFGPSTHSVAEQSMVEFVLKPEGDKVRLTLTHSKIPDRGYKVGVSGGWHTHLAILQDRAEGKTPPAFWDVWRKYDGQYEKRYT